MIEFTYTELFLFVWAFVATCYAYMFRERDHNHSMFVGTLIKDKELREDFFRNMDEHTKEEHS